MAFSIDVTAKDGASSTVNKVDGAFGNLRKRIDRARDSLGRFTKDADLPRSKVQRLSSEIGKFAAAQNIQQAGQAFQQVGAAVQGAVEVAANFTRSIQTVGAVTGATGKTFADLTSKAKELGASTKFSATEAADAMAFLGQAGFSAQAVLGGVGSALNLAAAGNLELASAADIASNVMGGFGLQARTAAEATENMTRVADTLANAASNSNTSVEQMGQALSFVAPVANSVGLSLEETSAALGVLGDQGIQATRAGTALRGILSRLLKPSADAATVFDQLGIATDNLNRPVGSAIEVLDQMGKAGATAGDFLNVFGQRNQAAAQIIAGSIPRYEELTEGMENVSVKAEDMAARINEGLPGALDTLNASFESIQITIGDAIAPLVVEAAGAIQTLAQMVQELDPQIVQLGGTFAAIVGTLGPVAAAIGAFVAVLGSAAAPVAGVIAGVGAIGAILFTFRQELTEAAVGFALWAKELIEGTPVLREMAQAGAFIFDSLQAVGRVIVDLVSPAFNALVETIAEVFNFFREKGKAALEESRAALEAQETAVKNDAKAWSDFFEDSRGGAEDIKKVKVEVDGATTGVKNLGGAAKAAKVEVFNLAKAKREAAKQAKAFAKEEKEFTKAIGEFSEALLVAVDNFEALGGTSTDVFQEIARESDTTLRELAKWDGTTQDMVDAMERLGIKSKEQLDAIAVQAQNDYNLIRQAGVGTPDQIQEAWERSISAQIEALEAAGSSMTQEQAAQLAALKGQQEGFSSDSMGIFEKWGDSVRGVITGLGNDLVEGLFSGGFDKENISAKLKTLADTFKTVLFDAVKGHIDDFVQKGIQFLLRQIDSVFDAFGKLTSFLSGSATNAGINAATNAGINAATNAGVNAATNAATTAATAGSTAASVAGQAAGIGVQGVTSIVTGAISAVSGVIGNFQFAAMNKSLDLIVNHTLRIFNVLFQIKQDQLWRVVEATEFTLGQIEKVVVPALWEANKLTNQFAVPMQSSLDSLVQSNLDILAQLRSGLPVVAAEGGIQVASESAAEIGQETGDAVANAVVPPRGRGRGRSGVFSEADAEIFNPDRIDIRSPRGRSRRGVAEASESRIAQELEDVIVDPLRAFSGGVERSTQNLEQATEDEVQTQSAILSRWQELREFADNLAVGQQSSNTAFANIEAINLQLLDSSVAIVGLNEKRNAILDASLEAQNAAVVKLSDISASISALGSALSAATTARPEITLSNSGGPTHQFDQSFGLEEEPFTGGGPGSGARGRVGSRAPEVNDTAANAFVSRDAFAQVNAGGSAVDALGINSPLLRQDFNQINRRLAIGAAGSARVGLGNTAPNAPQGQVVTNNVEFSLNVSVNGANKNPAEIGDEVAKAGDRFIRRSLAPAMADAIKKNTGGVRDTLNREVKR